MVGINRDLSSKGKLEALVIWAQFHRAAKHKNLLSMKFLP